MDQLRQDLTFAFRSMARNSGYTAMAIATLALGIGANTAIFSVVDSVLLRPLPYHDHERIVRGWANQPTEGIEHFSFRVVEYQQLAAQSTSFSVVGADFPIDLTITGEGAEPERVAGAMATPRYFEVFGATPALGRTFTQTDLDDGNQLVAVVTHGFWTRRLGADPGVVGEPVILNGNSFVLLGVLPEDFVLVEGDAEVFIPYTVGTQRWIGRWLNLYGKLRTGVTITRAEGELNAVMAGVGERDNRSRGWTATFEPLREMVVGSVRPALVAMLGTVVLVLLISCANVANLALARTATREREIVVRLALGAGRARIVRQMLVESLVIALAAGGAGALLATWGVRALVILAPASIPRLDGVGVNPGVLAFALILSVAAGVLFGSAPALHASRSSIGASLRQQSRNASAGARGHRMLDMLVVAEIALALVLLVGAGLMLRSFSRLLEVDVGFNRSNVLALQVSPPAAKYRERHDLMAYYDRLETRIGALPGVLSVGRGSDLPLSGQAALAGGISEERWRAGERDIVPALQRVVNAEFFSTLQIPLLSGRAYDAGQDTDNPQRLVINQAFADALWPGENAVGKRLTSSRNPEDDDWMEIIGVVGNVQYEGMGDVPNPTLYQFHPHQSWRTMLLFVRTAGDPQAMIASARSAVRSLDADVPVYQVRVLPDVVDQSVAAPRFHVWLFGLFGAVALVLAAAGIYGVLSFAVAQRSREIGIRMAIGARQQSVIQMIMRRGLILVLAGSVLGLASAALATRVLQSLLYAVSPTDPATLAAVVFILGATALAACYIPARRASRVDPMVVLRDE
ncbi:MAG: ABC transporter permease [Gemmatimonadetes bacterium]|nr:ABC transporter permease [Gemmatimonadota bacterium]